MTNPASDLPTGVYPVSAPPYKHDANSKGDVLWFSPLHGWYKGGFSLKHWPNTTHWARIPDEPKVPSPADVVADCDAAFERWMDQFPTQMDPTATALMKCGFVGGYTYRGQP